MTILVTGGLGYVGAHVVAALRAHDIPVAIVDDGTRPPYRDLITPEIPVHPVSILDSSAIRSILKYHRVKAVVHLAALVEVGKSIVDPASYYRVNVHGSSELLDACVSVGVKRVVFASSAAAIDPISPYGETKRAAERMLDWYGAAYDLRHASLRLFNVAGADRLLGPWRRAEPHLIPRALEVALGRIRWLDIYGAASIVRDYVHVMDVASAFLCALARTSRVGGGGVWSVGTGMGSSVLSVLRCVEVMTGRRVCTKKAPPRTGDVATLVADIRGAREDLQWAPRRPTLEEIVSDAWNARR